MFKCLIGMFNHFRCKLHGGERIWDTNRDTEFAEWMYRHGVDVDHYRRYWHMYDGR